MAGVTPNYHLIRPTVADVLVAVHRTHGRNAAAVWATMLSLSGLAGHETDDDAFHRLLDAMAQIDPVSQISARSLRLRLRTYDTFVALQSPPLAETVGSPT